MKCACIIKTSPALSICTCVCAERLTTTHLWHVKSAIWDARAKWRRIGEALGLTSGTMDTIYGSDDDCMHEVVKMWIHTGKATMSKLLKALEETTVARGDIAKDIREARRKTGSKYCC